MSRHVWTAMLAALLAAVFTTSSVGSESGTSLYWQKVKLENELQTKLSGEISSTIHKKLISLRINIILGETRKKGDLGPQAPSPSSKNQGNSIDLGKLSLNAPTIGQDLDEENIFRNISAIEARILIDESAPEEISEVLDKIVHNELDPLVSLSKGAKAKIRVERIDSGRSSEQADKSTTDSFVKQNPLIAGIISALFLGFMLLIAFVYAISQYKAVELRKLMAQETRTIGTSYGQIRDESHTSQTTAAQIETRTLTSENEGIQKFKDLLERSPDSAAGIIRQWLVTPEGLPRQALALLPLRLSTDELALILGHLDLRERSTWKRILASSSSRDGSEQIAAFVASQTVDCILLPSLPLDEACRKRLATLTTRECADFMSSNVDLAPALAAALPPRRLVEIYSALSDDALKSITTATLAANNEAVSDAIRRLTSELPPQEDPSATSPRLRDLVQTLAPELGPREEKIVLDAIAENQDHDLLLQTVKESIPFELIRLLPVPVLKAVMAEYSLSSRAELICSTEGALRDSLLEAIGPPGTKHREMVDAELQQIESDEIRRLHLTRSAQTIQREFAQRVRGLLRHNVAHAELAEPILNHWLFERTGGTLGRHLETLSRGDEGRVSVESAA